MREIVCVHIGQTGIQIGQQFWELMMKEHGIELDGRIKEGNRRGDPYVMFDEDEEGLFVPRALFMDTDYMTIEELMKTDLGQLLRPEQLIYGKEVANNFSRGHYTVGKEIVDTCIDSVQYLISKCSNLDCVLVFNSMSGGTGTGVGSLFCERLSVMDSKMIRTSVSIMPSENNSSLTIEPYNFTFGLHSLLEHTDYNLLFDNQSLYKICENKLKIESPSFYDINKLICKYTSSISSSLRFNTQDSSAFENPSSNLQFESCATTSKKILSCLVPYPRIHFFLTSFSPYISDIDAHKIEHSTELISKSVLDPDSYMIYYDDKISKSLGSMFSYRGDVSYSEIVKTLPDTRERLHFTNYVPTGVLCSLANTPCVSYENESPILRSVSSINTVLKFSLLLLYFH